MAKIKSIVAAMRRSSVVKWLLRAMFVFAIWFIVQCAIISLDGLADGSPRAEPADVAIIFGNEVLSNGTPGPVLTARLQKGLELYRRGAVRRIVCSGGKGPKELWEAEVMRDWLIARGVEPALVLADNGGIDTFHTALNTKKLFDANDWHSAIVVSQFPHISRCKLAFRRFGITDVRGAHADFTLRDLKGMPHEFAGYNFYWVRRY